MVKKNPGNSTAFLARSVGYVGRVVHVPGHELGKSRPGIPGIRGYHGDRVVGLQIAAFSLILTTSKSWDPPSTMGHYRTPTPNAIFFEGNQRTFIIHLHHLWRPLKWVIAGQRSFYTRWVLQQNANTPEDFTPLFFFESKPKTFIPEKNEHEGCFTIWHCWQATSRALPICQTRRHPFRRRNLCLCSPHLFLK